MACSIANFTFHLPHIKVFSLCSLYFLYYFSISQGLIRHRPSFELTVNSTHTQTRSASSYSEWANWTRAWVKGSTNQRRAPSLQRKFSTLGPRWRERVSVRSAAASLGVYNIFTIFRRLFVNYPFLDWYPKKSAGQAQQDQRQFEAAKLSIWKWIMVFQFGGGEISTTPYFPTPALRVTKRLFVCFAKKQQVGLIHSLIIPRCYGSRLWPLDHNLVIKDVF